LRIDRLTGYWPDLLNMEANHDLIITKFLETFGPGVIFQSPTLIMRPSYYSPEHLDVKRIGFPALATWLDNISYRHCFIRYTVVKLVVTRYSILLRYAALLMIRL
jgi:hypothetical protein